MSRNGEFQHNRRSSTYSIPRKPLRTVSATSSCLDSISTSSHPTQDRQIYSIISPYYEDFSSAKEDRPSNALIDNDQELADKLIPDFDSPPALPLLNETREGVYETVNLREGIDPANDIQPDLPHPHHIKGIESDEKCPETSTDTIEKAMSEDGSKDELRLVPVSEKELPDWRPNSLSWTPYVAFLILLILITYSCLYWRSKVHGIITPVHSKYDWIFRFGPAFLAVLIQEIVLRMATDLKSVLPFIAAASRPVDHIRRRPLARFTERKWYDGFHIDHLFQATTFLVRYCTFILVPLQSSLLSMGSRHYSTHSRSFQVVDADKLVSSLNHTRIPGLALDSIWHGEPVAPFKWLSFMNENPYHHEVTVQPDYVGVMPFVLDNSNSFSDPDQFTTWKVQTSAIYGYMNCTQIDEIQLSVAHIWIGTSGLKTDRMSVRLVDKEGCTFEQTWANVSSASGPSVENPITWDGNFALWQTLDGHQGNHTKSSPCPRYKHFIATGPLTVPYTIDPKNESKIAHTREGSHWAAMSCQPRYNIIRDGIIYEVDADDQTFGGHASIKFGDGEMRPDDERLDYPMKRNFLDSSLVYNLSSPVFRRTFWNAPMPNAFGSFQTNFSELYGDTDREGCKDVTTEWNKWDNDNACQMYLNVATLWPLLVAGMVSLSALYVPLEDQVTKSGLVHTYRFGWYLTGWELTYTTILHFVLLWLITKERVLHLPSWFRHILCTSRWGQSKYKTGLYGTPSSIAGLAFVFQDRSLQPLFERLDTMKPSLAVKKSRKRFDESELLLRKWRVASDEDPKNSDVSYAMIRPRNGRLELRNENRLAASGLALFLADKGTRMKHVLRKIKFWESSDRSARRLRYGRVPPILHPLLLMFIFLGTMAIIGVVYKFIVRSHSSGFQMWFQPTYALSQRSRDEVLRYVQKALFKGLPTLVLVSIGFWWESVERFYRATQPYASLANGANGRMSVCLDYIHSFHITASIKALRNGHFLLAYVTFTSFAVKLGVVLTSGIFSMNEIGHNPGRDLPLSRNWRDGTFVNIADDNLRTNLKHYALSRAVFGNPHTPGWKFEPWVFPSVRLDGPQFQLNLTGLASFLECSTADTSFLKVGPSNYTASLKEGDCLGNTWNNICLPAAGFSGQDRPQNLAEACMSWRYIDEANCSKLSPGSGGRWWIMSINGTLDPHSQDLTFLSDTRYISLVCRPVIYKGNTAMSVVRNGNGEVWINEFVSSIKEVAANSTWMADTDPSLDLITYSSRLLNDTFAGELYPATDEAWFDYFSIITVMGSIGGTDMLFNNATAMANAVSDTYSRVFSALISQNIASNETGEGSTVLLQAIPTSATKPPLIPVSPFADMATVALVPLYFATGILGFYCSAIIFIWPRRKRRMPLDISYPANAMTLVYDSSLLDIIRNCRETSGFKALHKLQFSIGRYQGMSGEMRIGIDLKERVTEIGMRERFCGLC
ncbi:uncharacterized protein BDR25DRAFT_339701 [Lindgomyces ingoldianus]|uniref:Uncharacterized protein n=1 Tax=Lindgomyces ingoldianus TaxID=673940 RepID=A0ACB6R991_9PLEO|nr:uncharacterized protein BDR25DRAFT_339701 [Lindgomyces ingoldianus]KAF2475652.1 hypothetical protein BDR25DRAFT_339701 [Lindgomyces ingoldianus]